MKLESLVSFKFIPTVTKLLASLMKVKIVDSSTYLGGFSYNTSGWEYDLAGNLIRGKDGTAWQKFEYDAAGRLVKIKNDSNTLLEEYTYGAGRERLKVETSSSRRYFAWGGQNVVAEYTETGSGTSPEYSKSYIYAGSRVFMTATKASSTTETKEFHHPDRLGTQLVTDGASGTSFRQSTMPFGTAISTETTGNTNQVFTSYDRSSTTGLDYAQNRTYSKGQSRFTQVDPIAMASTSRANPQSNNLFAYVLNMPTDFIDPRGLNSQPPNCGPGRVPMRDALGVWQCVGVGSIFVNSTSSPDPGVLTGAAAILFLWNPIRNTSGGGITIDSGIGGGGGGPMSGECIPGFPCPEAEKERRRKIAECAKRVKAEFEERVLSMFRETSPNGLDVWVQVTILGTAGYIAGGIVGAAAGAMGGGLAYVAPFARKQSVEMKKINKELNSALANCAPVGRLSY